MPSSCVQPQAVFRLKHYAAITGTNGVAVKFAPFPSLYRLIQPTVSFPPHIKRTLRYAARASSDMFVFTAIFLPGKANSWITARSLFVRMCAVLSEPKPRGEQNPPVVMLHCYVAAQCSSLDVTLCRYVYNVPCFYAADSLSDFKCWVSHLCTLICPNKQHSMNDYVTHHLLWSSLQIFTTRELHRHSH